MKQEVIESVRKDCRTSCTSIENVELLKGQTILVTGGTGFVGKWIAETIAYLNEEHQFKCTLYLLARDGDRFKAEVSHLAKLPFIHIIEQDIRNVSDLPQDISFVIHAAASPDNRDHASQPIKTIETIVRGTQALLDALLRLPNLTKVIHLSSNNVYGSVEGKSTTISETDMGISNCNSVNAAYSEAKRLAETLCAVYRNQQRLPIVTIRPFAFIGPYQRLDKPWAVNNFIRDSILGGPIRILGNEKTVRSYLYGSDMAFWLLAALAKGKEGAIYNIGSNDAISLFDLAQKIISNFPHKLEIVNKSSKEYSEAPSVSVPNISSIQSDLKVKQTIDLTVALKQTIDWYQKAK